MWITFGLLCCLAATTLSAEDHKQKPKDEGREKRNLQYQITHHYSGPHSYRSERRISTGPHLYQTQFHSGPRPYTPYLKGRSRSLPVPPYAVQMEPLVHYSQRDPLYDANSLSLHADGRYDHKKPLDDLQTEHNHLSEHAYYPPRAQIIEKPVYIKEPEPIIEIIIKESNVTLPPPPTPPPTLPPKKKKEQVHVFYVKYKKNSNGYGKDSIIYDKPIAAISPTVATEEEEVEHQPQYYPEPVVTQPPPPSTTLRTIIKPDSEVYHGPSGIKVTFGKEGFDYHKRQSKPEDFNKPLDDVKIPSSPLDAKFPSFPSHHQARQLTFPPSSFDRQNNFERLNTFDNKRIPLSPVPNFRPVSFPRQPQAYRPFSTPYKTPQASQFSRPQAGPPEYSTLPKSVYESQQIQAKPQLPFPQFSSQYSTLPQLDQPRKPVPYQPFETFRTQNIPNGRDSIPFRPQHSFTATAPVSEKPKFPSFQPNPIPSYKTIPNNPPLKPQFHNFRDGPHIQHQPQFNGPTNINPKQPIASLQHPNFQQTIQSQPPQSHKEFPNTQQQSQFIHHHEQPVKQSLTPQFSSNQQQNNFNHIQQNSLPQRPQFNFNQPQIQQSNFNQIQSEQNPNGNVLQSDFHLNTIQQVRNIAPVGSQLIAAIPRFEQHISSVEPTPPQDNKFNSGPNQQFQQNFIYQQPQVAQSNIHKQTAKPQNVRSEYNSFDNNVQQQYRQANTPQENIRHNYSPNPEVINYSTQKPLSIYRTTQNTPSVTTEKTTSTSTEPEKPSTTTKDPKVLNAQLPDEVPEELRQQLLSSGILNHADISVLDYDKVGDIPLSALPPDQLANFFNAGGAQQISGSEPIPQYYTKDGDRIDKSFTEDNEDDQETAGSENIEVREKPQVEMKVVHYDPFTEQGQQVQNSYVSQDATQVTPVALNDDKYNRYLPLKVSGTQFPIPDVPELKGKRIDSVVVLAPINFDYKPSRKTRGAKEEDFEFVQGEELRKLLRNPTQENYMNFLKSEAKRKSEQQAVILLVTGSNEENREIFMYDVGTKSVNKLDGSLSAAFVKAAEENDPNSQKTKSLEDSTSSSTKTPEETTSHSSNNKNIPSDKLKNVASHQI